MQNKFDDAYTLLTANSMEKININCLASQTTNVFQCRQRTEIISHPKLLETLPKDHYVLWECFWLSALVFNFLNINYLYYIATIITFISYQYDNNTALSTVFFRTIRRTFHPPNLEGKWGCVLQSKCSLHLHW